MSKVEVLELLQQSMIVQFCLGALTGAAASFAATWCLCAWLTARDLRNRHLLQWHLSILDKEEKHGKAT